LCLSAEEVAKHFLDGMELKNQIESKHRELQLKIKTERYRLLIDSGMDYITHLNSALMEEQTLIPQKMCLKNLIKYLNDY